MHRSLTIRTDPPGALVYVNDALKGASPLTFDFVWYGWYRVMLRKEGFERLDDQQRLRAPFYFWIPFDLAMELLPFPIRDDRTWSYTLIPAASPPSPVPPEFLSAGLAPPAEEAAAPHAVAAPPAEAHDAPR